MKYNYLDMKRILIIISAFYLTNYAQAQSQDKKTEIVINFQELEESIREETILKPVKFGSFHTFKIEGINKFLYEVTLEGKKIELETPIPSELQALFRLSKEELATTATTNEVTEIIEDVGNVEKRLKTFIELKTGDFDYTLNQKSNLLTPALTASDKFLLEEQINDIQERLADLEKFKRGIEKFLLLIKELENEFFKLKLTRIELVVLAQKDISFKEMKKLVNKIDKPGRVNLLHNDLVNIFKELKNNYQEILKNTNETEKVAVNALFKKLEGSFSTLDEASALSLYSEVNFLYSELKNENNFRVISPPTQADGDIVNYEVTITPSQTNSLGPNRNPMTFDFDVPVRGGLKVDFSVGPVLSFGNGAKDEKYFLETTDTQDISVLRQRDNNNSINPGIGAFMHFYKRSGTNTSFGGLFGVGAGFQSVEDINLSFYTGVSLVMGKSQKIMLNTGISFLNVERLKEEEFKVSNEYQTSNFDLGNITERVFKPSFFLSITYNLTNRVER